MRGRLMLVGILIPLAFTCWCDPAVGQYPTILRWVDGKVGLDSNNGTSPLPGMGHAGPWKHLSWALSQVAGQPGAVIKVIGRLDGSGNPVRHDTTLGESFPLRVGRGQRIERDSLYSEAPVIIDGTGVSGYLIRFGYDGQASGSFSGLKDIWVYDSGTLSSPQPGVLVKDTATTGTFLNPTFSGLRFNRCTIGLNLTANYATISPTISNCRFYNSGDSWDTTAPRDLDWHIGLYASTGATVSPTISGCTLNGDVTSARVKYGIRIHSGGDISPTISTTSIGNVPLVPYQIPASNKGMAYGIRARVIAGISGGKSDFQLSESIINGCYVNGIDMVSYSSTISQPLIEKSTITRNGRLYPSPTSETRGNASGPFWHYTKGHGIRMWAHVFAKISPTIRNNSVAFSGQISSNTWDGIHLASGIPDTEDDTATRTVMNSQVTGNTIEHNGRYGLYNSAVTAKAQTYVMSNTISHNTWAGVVNFSRGVDQGNSAVGTTYAIATLADNTIFGDAPAGASQRTGVLNDRAIVYKWGPSLYSSQARLIEVHDTVAQNNLYGIRNVDAYPGLTNPGSAVQNTVSWYNRKTSPYYYGKDMAGFSTGQVSYSDFYEASPPAYYNIKVQPSFVSLATYDFHLYYSPGNFSPVIDKATNTPITGPPYYNPTVDFDGQPRRVDKPGVPNVKPGHFADMGADEVQ